MYLPMNCFQLRSLASCAALWEGLRGMGERFKLALPLQLKNGAGMTRDISTSGIFFETDRAYAIGATIQLSLHFEHESLQCKARVVRVEPRNGQFGVAVQLTSYVFC